MCSGITFGPTGIKAPLAHSGTENNGGVLDFSVKLPPFKFNIYLYTCDYE